jgi:hypothetical protein
VLKIDPFPERDAIVALPQDHGAVSRSGVVTSLWGRWFESVRALLVRVARILTGIYNVKDYGAKGDGVANDSVAFGLALADIGVLGGTIYIPDGTYMLDTLTWALSPKRVNYLGAGMGATIIQSSAIDSKLFQAPQSGGGVVQHITLSHFSVKAHASGSTGAAIDLRKTRSCTFSHLEYLSNGTGNYADLFLMSSDPPSVGDSTVCLGHLFERIVDTAQSGPGKLWHFVNTAGSAYSANIHTIRNCFVYACSGITHIIDGLRGNEVVIEGCLFESNDSAIYILPGTNFLIQGNHFEHVTGHVGVEQAVRAESHAAHAGDGGGVSNNVTLIGNYFSGSGFLDPDLTDVHDWLCLNNAPAANFAPTGVTADGNHYIQYGKRSKSLYLTDGVADPSLAARFQIDSTNEGALLPRMTTAQRQAMNAGVPIVSADEGLLVYDLTLHKLFVYTDQAGGAGTKWEAVTSVLE